MPEKPVPRLPQAAQFGLRKLLTAVTIIAVLAAIAGPFFRHQTPTAQRALLVLWTSVVIFTAVGMWLSVRTAFLLPPTAGTLKYLLLFAWRPNWSPIVRGLGFSFSLAIVSLVTMWFSYECAKGATHFNFALLAYHGSTFGLSIGSLIYVFSRRPAPVCEAGILIRGEVLPWRYIRGVEWLPNRSEICRLVRYDGDLYLVVPAQLRDEFDEFLRNKTGLEGKELTTSASRQRSFAGRS
jgi:hypothetical protein